MTFGFVYRGFTVTTTFVPKLLHARRLTDYACANDIHTMLEMIDGWWDGKGWPETQVQDREISEREGEDA